MDNTLLSSHRQTVCEYYPVIDHIDLVTIWTRCCNILLALIRRLVSKLIQERKTEEALKLSHSIYLYNAEFQLLQLNLFLVALGHV